MAGWTDEAIVMMKSLFELGQSGTQIKDELNARFGTAFSRNAVIGKLHRVGLRRAEGFIYQGVKRQRRERAPRRQYRKSSVQWTPEGIAPVRLPVECDMDAIMRRQQDDAAIPRAQRKTLWQLKPGDCRWPVGDPGTPDFFFCGAAKIKGAAYCRAHHVRAYQPGSRRIRPMGSGLMRGVTVLDRDFEVA